VSFVPVKNIIICKRINTKKQIIQVYKLSTNHHHV